MFGRMPSRRRVRLHLVDAPGVELPSVEGYLVGRRYGHYLVEIPKIVRAEHQTLPLESRLVEIPAERVAFYEVIR